MAVFALYGCAAVGVVACAACVGLCLYVVVLAAGDRVGRAVAARRRGAGRAGGSWGLEDMPGHPERVPGVGELAGDMAFWDAAQELLNDPGEPQLADVCEELGWLR
jgi:hypothetical protein